MPSTKADFTDEDGLRAADLEAEFAELGGWEAESDASCLLQGLGIGTSCTMSRCAPDPCPQGEDPGLAQAPFGNPDIVMPTSPPTTWTSKPSTGWRISSDLPRHGHRREP